MTEEDEKDLAEQKARAQAANLTLEQPKPQAPTPTPAPVQADVESTETCGASAWFDGKARLCTKPVGHDGKHKRGAHSWRPRSGDRR